MHLIWLLIERKNKKIQEEYYHDIWNFEKILHHIKHTDRPINDLIDKRLCGLCSLKNQEIKIIYYLHFLFQNLVFGIQFFMVFYYINLKTLKIIFLKILLLYFHFLLDLPKKTLKEITKKFLVLDLVQLLFIFI